MLCQKATFYCLSLSSSSDSLSVLLPHAHYSLEGWYGHPLYYWALSHHFFSSPWPVMFVPALTSIQSTQKFLWWPLETELVYGLKCKYLRGSLTTCLLSKTGVVCSHPSLLPVISPDESHWAGPQVLGRSLTLWRTSHPMVTPLIVVPLSYQ